MRRFMHTIATIDSHTAGEPTRLVIDGLPPIEGATMAEKLAYAGRHLGWAPGLLMLEPRGHRDMFGAVLVPRCDPAADIGVLFMDNRVYEPMCGHGVIGAVTCLLEERIFPAVEPVTVITLDTAAGLVRAFAAVEGGRVTSVTFENAPAFVWRRDVIIEVPGLGKIVVDIAFGGNFFVMVRAEQTGLALVPENAHRLAVLGMGILKSANAQIAIRHPDLPHIDRAIDLRFYTEPGSTDADSRNVVVLGDHMVDRSPCGTGTCAELALHHARGRVRIGQPWVVESIIGTRFTGEIVAETRVGQGADAIPAVIPRITGSAYITGRHRFVLDPRDPFPQGFMLGS